MITAAMLSPGRTTVARTARCCTLGGLGTIAYVVVGYPAIITAWSFVRGERAVAKVPPRPVSVVISAHNEARVIGRKLASLAEGDYPFDQLQVIVSDDGSTDGTAEVVRLTAPWAEVVRAEHRTGKMGAMSRGMARVRHDIVVFSDAENVLSPAALTELLAPFADPRVGAVNGRFVPAGGGEAVSTGEHLYWRYEDLIKRAESNVGSLTGILGALLAVRTELVPEFPPHVINDDFYVGMQVARQGYRVAYASRATTSESGAATLVGDANRRARMTAGRWQTVRHWRDVLPVGRPKVMWQVMSHKYLRLALPFAMVAALLGPVAELITRRSKPHPRNGVCITLTAELLVYSLAATADRIPQRLGPARVIAQGLRYLVRTNLAAGEGFWQFVTRPEDLALWDHVEKRVDRP